MPSHAERRRIAREYVAKIRATTACAHCGAPMRDWHNPEHVQLPIRRIARMVGIGRSIAAIQAEIDVCVPLCRRCHMAEDRPTSRPTPTPGELNCHAKLTWDKAREIRSRRDELSAASLASTYGVTKVTITEIIRGKTWRDPDYVPRRKRRVEDQPRKAPAPKILKGNFKAQIRQCLKGHPYNESNTYLSRGRRYCKTCHREQVASARARRKLERD